MTSPTDNLILNPPDVATPIITLSERPVPQLGVFETSSSEPSVGGNAPVSFHAQEGATLTSPTSDTSLATPVSAVESPQQCELPRVLPTPGRELGRLAERAQDGWEKLFQYMRQHERDLAEMNKIIQRHRFHLESKFETYAIQTQEQFTCLTTTVMDTKEKQEKELDSMMKAMTKIAVDECDKIKVATSAELSFLVEQLQIELQTDFKTSQSAIEKTHTDIITHGDQLTECISLMKHLSAKVDSLSAQVDNTGK